MADHDILVKVDRIALTANNITYAVAGDSLGYWYVFPAMENASAKWGMIPVWGFANVGLIVDMKSADE